MRAFVAVARAGSFTRAAAQLFITQSALSSLIRNLEGELELRLLDRTTRRLELTEGGRELLVSLEQLLADLDRITSDLREVKEIRRGRVRIGATPLLAASVLPVAIQAFGLRYPGITVRALDASAPELIESLRAGELDLMLATLDGEHPELRAQVLLSDTMVLVCPCSHRFAQQPEVAWSEALAEPMIAMRKGSGLRAIVDHALVDLGGTARPVQEVNHVATAIAMVGAGLGVAILPAYAVRFNTVGEVCGVPLAAPTLSRHVSLATLRQRTPAAAALAMQEHLMEFVKGLHSM
ncbi:DNA-binding transcriptional LysR family regulator [Variovorax paradoxus]|nr:DNA-binding transcriptional LysR family regulator [Variovorax paradoxus]